MHRIFLTTGGGLGNQILTYSLYKYLQKCGLNVYLYLRKDSISDSFQHINYIDKKWYHLFYISYRKIQRIFDKLKINRLNFIRIYDFPDWDNYGFMSEIVNSNLLVFKEDKNPKNISLRRKMLRENSVSIHVRRGDYQADPHWRTILGDICDEEYYIKAINYVKNNVRSPIFYVFSDDINWTKHNLGLSNVIYINWNNGKEAFRDIELMTYCKVNIIANSTFSLSGAWLNINDNPIRIVPKKWLNSIDDNLLCRYSIDKWVVIDNVIPQISIVINNTISDRCIKDILNQTFSDFEIILFHTSNDIIDHRVKSGNVKPRGRIIYEYTECSSQYFKDPNYLKNWLLNIYITNNV